MTDDKQTLSLEPKESPTDHGIQTWIDACNNLNGHALIIHGWVFHSGIAADDLEFVLNLDPQPDTPSGTIPHTLMRITRPDVSKHFAYNGHYHQWGFLILVDLNQALSEAPENVTLHIKNGATEVPFKMPEITMNSLNEVTAPALGWANAEQAALTSYLHQILGDRFFDDMDECLIASDTFNKYARWHWDNIIVVPEQGVFISGWLLDGKQSLMGGFIRTRHGEISSNLLSKPARYTRPDVLQAFPGEAPDNYKAGFYHWVPMPGITENTQLELVLVSTSRDMTAIPLDHTLADSNIHLEMQQVTVNFDINSPDYQFIMSTHIGPALSAIWSHRKRQESIKSNVLLFGKQPEKPKRSVIVPLYGRYDFLLHQISQFAKDPDFSETELIYVLDDPKLYDAFIPFCHDSSELFPVAFKVVYCGRNLGYAGANNLGARHANSDKLVLLNSDIIPSQPGWLSRMEKQASKLDHAGVVAPKLVFEDGTIQHLGMSFNKSTDFGGIWLNEHPGKGNPEWLMPADKIMEAPAVTGACMFISRSLYNEAGGLDESYILGDFEDSDLCLKLQEKGYRHYIITDEKLFHLERQSQNLFPNKDWKFKITLYNAWQHNQRWGSLIEKLVSQG